MSEFDYYLSFAFSPGIGPKRFSDLLKALGSAHVAWEASTKELRSADLGEKTIQTFLNFRKTFDIKKQKNSLADKQIIFIPQNSKKYPPSLHSLPNPPIGLFVKGNVDLLSNNILAVVGSRKTTQYGREITKKLTEQISFSGVTIISGLALGIDAVAHASALNAGGGTIAVLGCGVDCCYPQENYALYKSILSEDGLIISEYPPGTPPSKGSFPARNRIIAALSDGILVTEATEDSGSLITADWGQRLSKKIFSVPGPINSQNSQGTLLLIQKGAKLIRTHKDILDDMVHSNPHVLSSARTDLKLEGVEKNIYEALSEEKDIDLLARELKMSVVVLNSYISDMELGDILKSDNGRIRRV